MALLLHKRQRPHALLRRRMLRPFQLSIKHRVFAPGHGDPHGAVYELVRVAGCHVVVDGGGEAEGGDAGGGGVGVGRADFGYWRDEERFREESAGCKAVEGAGAGGVGAELGDICGA